MSDSAVIRHLLEGRLRGVAVLGPDGRVSDGVAVGWSDDWADAVDEAIAPLRDGVADSVVFAPDVASNRRWRLEAVREDGELACVLAFPGAGSLSMGELAEIANEVDVGLSIIRVPDAADPDSMRIEFTNKASVVASRTDTQATIGRGFLEAFPMIRETPFPQLYSDVVTKREPVRLPEIRYGDDRVAESVFRVKLAPVGDDLVLGEYVNVTAVEHARLQLEDFFESAPVALLEATPDSDTLRVTRANEQARAALGIGLDEVDGHDLAPYLAPADLEALRWAIQRGDAEFEAEVDWTRGVTRVHYIITAHRLDPLQDRIALALADVTPIHSAKQRLEQANRRLDDFTRIVSHDLKAPLRTVCGFADVVITDHADELDERALAHLNRVREAGKRMNTLITDLLELARIGAEDLGAVSGDPVKALELVRQALAGVIAEKQAVVEYGKLPSVMLATPHLTQMFQNLIGNALTFNEADVPKVTVTATRRRGKVRFAVTDNGIGIEAKFLERIMEPFQRLHTQAEFPGTGLGLALVRTLVEGAGGAIAIDSEPGRGTTFRVTLPAAD